MTKGLDEILANLTKLEVKAPKTAKSAVTEVAKEFEKALKANTPVYEIETEERLKKILLSVVLKELMSVLFQKKSVMVKQLVGVLTILTMGRFINAVRTLRKKQSIR